MIKAHKIRLNPTDEQAAYFRRAAGCSRFVFNWGLAEWARQYESGGKPSALALKREFNAIKLERFPFVLEVTKTAVEGAFMDLGKAFANFFRGRKEGLPVGYPKFRSKKRSKASFYIANDKIKFAGYAARIPRLGWVNMTEALRFEGRVIGARIREQAGWWWLSVQVEVAPEPVELSRGRKEAVGIDLGLKDLVTTSDGERLENQKPLKRSLGRIKGLQRSLSRKVKGSANYLKAKLKLARAHHRVACQRADTIHKLTTRLCRDYRMIGIEDLNVKGLLKNHCLAQSMSDAAIGTIRRQLEYKAVWHGAALQTVDRFYPSSQRCHCCGWRNESLTLSERQWGCENCGVSHQRDVNAAINIRDEALRLIRLGGGYVETKISPVDGIALA